MDFEDLDKEELGHGHRPVLDNRGVVHELERGPLMNHLPDEVWQEEGERDPPSQPRPECPKVPKSLVVALAVIGSR